MKNILSILFLTCLTNTGLIYSQGSGEVIITEIHNRPSRPTQAQLDAALPNNPPGADLTPDEGHVEWFEVFNTTDAPVVMDGWTLNDASSSSRVSTISSFTLPANSYAVFSGFNIPAAHGGVVFDYFFDYEQPSFNNESSYQDVGDTSCPDGVRILKADGSLVDEVLYDYGYGHYLGNPGSSSSCRDNTTAIGLPAAGSSSRVSFMLNVDPAVMNAASNNLASNWSYSTIEYDPGDADRSRQLGTPGLQNDGSVVNNPLPDPNANTGTGEVIITEIHNRPQRPTQAQVDAALPNNPPGADLTPDEGHVEWFEIYNTTNAPVVMDGWTLTDGSARSRVSVIGNFTIAANSYAVLSGFNIPDAQGGVVFDYFYDYEMPGFNNESSYADVGDTSCPDGVIIEKADGTLVDQVLYDYGYGNYIGNPNSPDCMNKAAPIGIPQQDSPSRTSFMLNVNPAIMNSAGNDLPSNWSFSTNVYDPGDADRNQQLGTPGQQNDGSGIVIEPPPLPMEPECLIDHVLSGVNATSGLIEAIETISSTELINAASVGYNAGTTINLDPTFEVVQGTEFHAYILGCAPGPTGQFVLDPNKEPWENFDLQDWVIDTPAFDPSDGNSLRHGENGWNALPNSDSRPFFFTHTDGGMRFVSTVGGARTSQNTSFVRSELREMLRRGDTSISTQGVNGNNWALGYQPSPSNHGGRNGTLSATLRINKVTTTGNGLHPGRVIIGQIHADNDEPLRLYYRKMPNDTRGCIYAESEIRDGNDVNFGIIGNENCNNPVDGIALNELFSYDIVNMDDEIIVNIKKGDITAPVSHTVTIDISNAGYDRADEWMYFKAGAYTQNNTGNPADSDIITFYRLLNYHGAN